MTLFSGAIITTGTPKHVLGMEDGDRVEVEINFEAFRRVNFFYDAKRHQ
jgi:2-keto-4-pentenoate hydratase/2-oxohepta-3-ene-1,7-dioic acid hydratase in catechol pathway